MTGETELLDNTLTVETPEGVRIQFHPAGLYQRSIAYLIDLVIHGCALFIISLLSFLFADIFGTWFVIILYFLIHWFLPVVFEMTMRGATPGKAFLGLHTIMSDGTPLTFQASIMRNLLRVADFFAYFPGFGIIAMFMTQGNQRLGDLAAGTVVVKNTSGMNFSSRDRDNIKSIQPLRPHLTLYPEEQAALIALSGRARFIGRERSQEITNILSPLIPEEHRTQAGGEFQALLSYAAWYSGKNKHHDNARKDEGSKHE